MRKGKLSLAEYTDWVAVAVTLDDSATLTQLLEGYLVDDTGAEPKQPLGSTTQVIQKATVGNKQD